MPGMVRWRRAYCIGTHRSHRRNHTPRQSYVGSKVDITQASNADYSHVVHVYSRAHEGVPASIASVIWLKRGLAAAEMEEPAGGKKFIETPITRGNLHEKIYKPVRSALHGILDVNSVTKM